MNDEVLEALVKIGVPKDALLEIRDIMSFLGENRANVKLIFYPSFFVMNNAFYTLMEEHKEGLFRINYAGNPGYDSCFVCCDIPANRKVVFVDGMWRPVVEYGTAEQAARIIENEWRMKYPDVPWGK